MKLALRHPEPLLFERADGTAYTVPMPTRGQMRAALSLDPADPDAESEVEADARRALQLEELTRGSGLPHGELTRTEEEEILAAIMAAHHQFDPAQAVAIVRLKKKARLIGALAALNALTGIPAPLPSA
jgi:hypothetical protein